MNGTDLDWSVAECLRFILVFLPTAPGDRSTAGVEDNRQVIDCCLVRLARRLKIIIKRVKTILFHDSLFRSHEIRRFVRDDSPDDRTQK